MLPFLSFFKERGQYSRVLIVILLCIDFASFVCAIKTLELQPLNMSEPALVTHAYISILAWLITASYYQLFSHNKLQSIKTIIYKHLEALPLLILIQASVFALLRVDINLIIPILILNLYALASVISVKSLLFFLYLQFRRQHKNRYVIVGYSTVSKNLYQYLQQHKNFGYQFLGFFDDQHAENTLVRGNVEHLYQFCLEHKVDHIYLTINNQPILTNRIAEFADSHFIYFGYLLEHEPLQENILPQPNIHLVPLSTINLSYL